MATKARIGVKRGGLDSKTVWKIYWRWFFKYLVVENEVKLEVTFGARIKIGVETYNIAKLLLFSIKTALASSSLILKKNF